MPVLDPQALLENRLYALRAYHDRVGLPRAELDVSGGIDSAVMLGLLVRALGPQNVTAAYSSIHSSEKSLQRARAVAEAVGVPLIEMMMGESFDRVVTSVISAFCSAHNIDRKEVMDRMQADPRVVGSFRSCFRAPIGRFINRLAGDGIRHGTGNEDEDRWLRFYQKGGDGEVDTNPLAMLSKGEVYQLAVHMGIPSEVIVCKPTPDLWGADATHDDEEELTALSGVPWTYSKVDPESGEYLEVGTIERLSRLLDLPNLSFPAMGSTNTQQPLTLEGHLFTPCDPSMAILKPHAERLGLTVDHLISAWKWERATRHKANPNIPTLGSRSELVMTGILTDDLPLFGI